MLPQKHIWLCIDVKAQKYIAKWLYAFGDVFISKALFPLVAMYFNGFYKFVRFSSSPVAISISEAWRLRNCQTESSALSPRARLYAERASSLSLVS
ncbi:hypothetical protein [Paenibacillus arenilitoris]|uniref:hypothetical protein n=1 Tax=Paenibacillus arenilitoris TaxID=2772299 RepID=UPI0016849715|nr:hypothetical protein [Paenibacillus arenilitoris]